MPPASLWPRHRLPTSLPGLIADVAALRAPLPPLSPCRVDIIGLIGAIVFWPSTVYFPVAMYIRVHSPPRWQRGVMSVVNAAAFVVSVLAAIGSIYNISQEAHTYKVFGR